MDTFVDQVRHFQRIGELYAALTHCARATSSSSTDQQLFDAVCRSCVEMGCMKMAWIGRIDDVDGCVVPVASFGAGVEVLQGLRIPTDPAEPLGNGPTGRVVTGGQPVWSEDFATDPTTTAWHAHSRAIGVRASAALPIRRHGRIAAVLNLYSGEHAPFDAAARELLVTMAMDLSHALDAIAHATANRLAVEQARAHAGQMQRVLLQTVGVATHLLELSDPYTAGHQQRVSDIATAIAAKMGFDADRIEGLRIAALLHDIGKISAPAEILAKPRRLSEAEMSLVRGHSQAGYDVLARVDFPWPVAEVVLQHHERMDGSGYPRGLRGDAILPEARIIAVCDTVEAMASHRPYRAALGIGRALEEIERGSGTAFDADVADACLRLFRQQGFVLPATD
jgi:putative nucleotidyltransferase with HDIG domain